MANVDDEQIKQASRLRELFRGRFDQDTAVRLVTELGGLLPAVDFVLNEPPDQVSAFLKQSPSYLQKLRDDSANVASILENNIEDSVRQFVCGSCKRIWWRRVPLRKEVSECRRCHIKYDPIPHEQESGLAKFICSCNNQFTHFAIRGETLGQCRECGEQVPVDHMVPPNKNWRNKGGKGRRRGRRRSSNASNSAQNHQFVINDQYEDVDVQPYASPAGMISDRRGQQQGNQDAGRGRGRQHGFNSGPGRAVPVPDHEFDIGFNQAPEEPPVPSGRTLRYISKPHVSTGSTVSTFLSQRSIDTESVSIMSELFTIPE